MRIRSRRLIQAVLSAAAIALVLSACASARPSSDVTSSPTTTHITAIPQGSGALFFGDSWTAGYGVPAGDAFPYGVAKTLSLRAVVEGQPGSGYLASLVKGSRPYPARTDRLKAQTDIRLIVLQGGINDADLPSLGGLDAAMTRTIDDLAKLYPDVPILLMGPAPSSAQPTTQLRDIDQTARAAAKAAGIAYVSPIAENWVNALNVRVVISSANAHPTIAGQAYLAQRLVNDIRLLQQGGELSVPHE